MWLPTRTKNHHEGKFRGCDLRDISTPLSFVFFFFFVGSEQKIASASLCVGFAYGKTLHITEMGSLFWETNKQTNIEGSLCLFPWYS